MIIKSLQKEKIVLMKERNENNKEIISIINEIITAQKNKLVALSTQRKTKVETLTETEEIAVIQSIKKQLEQEIEGLKNASRSHEKQSRQLDFVEGLLPKVKTEKETRKDVEEFILKQPDAKMKDVMGHFSKNKTSYNMGLLSSIAKEIL